MHSLEPSITRQGPPPFHRSSDAAMSQPCAAPFFSDSLDQATGQNTMIHPYSSYGSTKVASIEWDEATTIFSGIIKDRPAMILWLFCQGDDFWCTWIDAFGRP